MTKLVAAAKKEGELNVIALPPTWANYGNIIKAFEDKYDIKINSKLPDTDSQTEIDTAKRLQGQATAPDVFDVGQAVAVPNTDMFAPYKVQGWDDIADANKDPDGLWANDYGGYFSIGYDSAQVQAPTSLEDLLGSDYKGRVALNGDPTSSGSGVAGVFMAAVANGGSLDDVAPGVEYFKQLNDAGNLIPVDVSSATISSGETPVVLDWDYLNAAASKELPSWKVVVPEEAVVGGYYCQAISKDAPHPNAARLWEEFLYSDEGQNLWLAGGARPIRADAMNEAGTIDKEAFSALPPVNGDPAFPTVDQSTKAGTYLADHWADAVS
ncbi:MAG: ABC transporter substrate-binding protein [Propionibacteriales bacterium]|nr:ABC transporter substrate-binding protein [Propionibacteriales bacterium]